MKTTKVRCLLAFVAALTTHNLALQAQTAAADNPQNNVVSAVAISQGLPQIATADLPKLGTYLVATYRGIFIPYPSPPRTPGAAFFLMPSGTFLVDPGNDQVLPANLLSGQAAASDALNSAIAAEVAAVAKLINQSQAQAQLAQFGGQPMMAATGTSFPEAQQQAQTTLIAPIFHYGTVFGQIHT